MYSAYSAVVLVKIYVIKNNRVEVQFFRRLNDTIIATDFVDRNGGMQKKMTRISLTRIWQPTR